MSAAKYYVALGHGCGNAGLKEITGVEEREIINNNSLSAIQLVDQLLVDNPVSVIKPGTAAELPICERDRLLAAIYIDTFGAVIQSDLNCPDCSYTFEFEFFLNDILSQVNQANEQALAEYNGRLIRNSGANYTLDNTIQFNIPKGMDEIRMINSFDDTGSYPLLDECIVKNTHDTDSASIEEVIDRIAAMIELDMKVICPECQHESVYLFKIQDYLLDQLLVQRASLHRQVHTIALHYGWPLDQILKLTRSERLTYYEFIQRDLE